MAHATSVSRCRDGTVGGTLKRVFTPVQVATTCPSASAGGEPQSFEGPVTGTPANIQSNFQNSQPVDNGPQSGTGTWTLTHAFLGALSDGVITGTLSVDFISVITAGPSAGATSRRSYAIPLTLQ